MLRPRRGTPILRAFGLSTGLNGIRLLASQAPLRATIGVRSSVAISSAQQFAEAALGELTRWTGGGFDDDVTFVIAERARCPGIINSGRSSNFDVSECNLV